MQLLSISFCSDLRMQFIFCRVPQWSYTHSLVNFNHQPIGFLPAAFQVDVDGVLSDKRPIHASVSQGSALFPALLYFTNDIPTLAGHLQQG